MIGLGFGGLNEIIEFGATVISPNTGVGGYVNTALDLVADLIGALLDRQPTWAAIGHDHGPVSQKASSGIWSGAFCPEGGGKQKGGDHEEGAHSQSPAMHAGDFGTERHDKLAVGVRRRPVSFR